jgi:predicted HD phosphohydrolase
LWQCGASRRLADRSLLHPILDIAPYGENKLDREIEDEDHDSGVDEELEVPAA